MVCNNENYYNQFGAIDNATKVITDYLVQNNENLWKLLYYIDPDVLPLAERNLSVQEKAKMIATNPYEVNESVDKNILFITTIDEAFSCAIPQLRMEIGDVVPIDAYRAYMNIDFQIVVPIKQDIFTASYNNVARRSDAIFRELAKSLNGKIIPNSNFYGKMFMDKSAPSGAGRKTGAFRQVMNTNYVGRWCTFSVLI